MEKKGFVFWAPRILSLLFLGFLAIFSLDVFDGNYGFWGTVVGLFMHNIPVILLGLLLAVAWKRETVGGIAFLAAGFLYIALMIGNAIVDAREIYQITYSFIIAGPAFLIGILFLIGWKRKKKKKV